MDALQADAEDRLVVHRLGGAVTRERFLQSLQVTRSDAVLWDLREADLSLLTFVELRELVASAYPILSSGHIGRAALVCSTDLAYGVCRVYGALQVLQGVPVEHAVFRDADTALRWLETA